MGKNKNVVLGVCGGIAAYKACELISRLKRAGCNVDVILTANAQKFVGRVTFETLSGNFAVTDTFERPRVMEVEHVALAKKAGVFVIAPATADVIGKIANGIADDMLTTTVMAVKSPKLICPAMNTAMYENPIFQQNLSKLKGLGYSVMEPDGGLLACGDTGRGRLANVAAIAETVLKLLDADESVALDAPACKTGGCGGGNSALTKLDYAGKRVLVTAGATREDIDGVRFISNRSSGKTGLSIARAAKARGAVVTLVAAHTGESIRSGEFDKTVVVSTTEEMYDAVMSEMKNCDVIIKAAAPSDYAVKEKYPQKIKSRTLTLELVKNPDIAAAVGAAKTAAQRLVIFSAETQNLLDNAKAKLTSKKADMVVANDVTLEGAGFDIDTNIVTIMTKNGGVFEYPKLPKSSVADIILDKIGEL
ncbi:MAG: bifunctional phosphopantothenoylcysteine decarboxylase/phosphopantothenate synthase [Clostridiales bacterium]|nr:bifunctional phosphopantothenoylcysteine decarboxylase/phosphopantothenate synthase [Clostridiales bacterium]